MPIVGTSDVSTAYWTSPTELFNVFGQMSVRRWADLENRSVTADQDAVIASQVAAATDDAQSRLRGAPCGIIVTAPPMLRFQVTRLCGSMLYTGKGVKDTADEEGRNRLAWHFKQAMTWINKVIAGQIRLTGVTQAQSFPASVCLPGPPGMLNQHLLEEQRGLPFDSLDFQFYLAGGYPFAAYDTWDVDDPGYGQIFP